MNRGHRNTERATSSSSVHACVQHREAFDRRVEEAMNRGRRSHAVALVASANVLPALPEMAHTAPSGSHDFAAHRRRVREARTSIPRATRSSTSDRKGGGLSTSTPRPVTSGHDRTWKQRIGMYTVRLMIVYMLV